MLMQRRTVTVGLVVAALGGCSLGDPAPEEAVTDSTAAVTDSGPPGAVQTATATLPAAPDSAVPQGPPLVVSPPPPPVGDAQTATLDERLDRLLAAQEATNRRLDSITGNLPQQDSVRRLSSSGEVLGEAGQRVGALGVGIFWSAVVLVLFNILIRSLVWVLDTLAERNASRRLFFKRLVPIVRIILWIVAAYLIVKVIFQVDAQGIFAAAAAIGVAVGFAAQDLLKNLFGGIILVFDQPFQVGDKVSVGGTYGEVVSIGLRSTRIVTGDDNLVSVPNAQVVDQQVANANAGELNCQVVTDLFLPGWADEGQAKQIAFHAATSSKYVYLKKPIVVLVADVFKETFLTRVRVKAYVMDPRYEFLLQSDITERARAGFREAGLLKPQHMLTGLVHRSGVGVSANDEPTEGTPHE